MDPKSQSTFPQRTLFVLRIFETKEFWSPVCLSEIEKTCYFRKTNILDNEIILIESKNEF